MLSCLITQHHPIHYFFWVKQCVGKESVGLESMDLLKSSWCIGHLVDTAWSVQPYPNPICINLQKDPGRHLVKFVNDVVEFDRLSSCVVHLLAVGNMTKDFWAVAASRFGMVNSR